MNRGTAVPVSTCQIEHAFALRASVDSLRGYESEGWAHFEFTRINITPTILRKKIEDLREAHASPSGPT
jgi:hypothetical protein